MRSWKIKPRRYRGKTTIFFVGAGLVTCFLNLPTLRTLAPLALAQSLTQRARRSMESPMPSSGQAELDELILEVSEREGVDPRLVHAIALQESRYQAHRVSPRGARGLMQLMPATARRFDCTNLDDARQNLTAGARYLRFLLTKYEGDVSLTVAAYNAGEGAVEDYGGIPPYSETRTYVKSVTAALDKSVVPSEAGEDSDGTEVK